MMGKGRIEEAIQTESRSLLTAKTAALYRHSMSALISAPEGN
jgi:hypothetical protein